MKKNIFVIGMKYLKECLSHIEDCFLQIYKIKKDEGSAAVGIMYDGFSFDIVKESPLMGNGFFTDSGETGILYGRTGRPTGERWRYVTDNYRKTETEGNRYIGERTVLYAGGTAVGVKSGGRSHYLGSDIQGSVKNTTSDEGYVENEYSYDIFGTVISGSFTNGVDFAYCGKIYDPVTGNLNYGFRDYSPSISRFTTVDPVRDGTNWFAYCAGDSVNYVDLWGLTSSESTNDNSYESSGKIIIKGTVDEQNDILFLINSLSYKQYKISDSLLYSDNDVVNLYGSVFYSDSIDSLLNQGTTTIRIGNVYENEFGVDVQVPKDSKGNIQAGYTYGSTEAQIMNITITNNYALLNTSEDGYANIATPAEVLMHEIAGHAAPRMLNQQHNAIEIENQVRLEISNRVSGIIYGFKYLLRMVENHPSIP